LIRSCGWLTAGTDCRLRVTLTHYFPRRKNP